MWFGTDHLMCKDNFNLLWAWPTNAIAAFYIHSAKRPGTKYFMIYTVFNLVLFACWFFIAATFESRIDTGYSHINFQKYSLYFRRKIFLMKQIIYTIKKYFIKQGNGKTCNALHGFAENSNIWDHQFKN